MQPTHDRYQRYADLLGEPVTEDLRKFVDNFELSYQTISLPEELMHFNPSNSNLLNNEQTSLSKMRFPVSFRFLFSGGDNIGKRKWSLRIVSIVVILIAGGIFGVVHGFPRNDSPVSSVSSSPSLTNKYVTCIRTSSIDPYLMGTTSCDAVPEVTHFSKSDRAYYIYCFAPTTPISGMVINVVSLNGQYKAQSGVNLGLVANQGHTFCNESANGPPLETGTYSVYVYWNATISSYIMDGLSRSWDEIKRDKNWVLQVETSFDVK
jgi:hypothetical protein